MATTNTTKAQNVYQKLLRARAMFLAAEPKKSGKNMHLAFKYFELDDIVPITTKIFEEVGLIALVSFEEDKAKMFIVNTDNSDEGISFSTPMVQLSENKGTNAVQAFGATITYYRRYLYMIALDICEPDGIDAGMSATPTTAQSTTTQEPQVVAQSVTPVATPKPTPINVAPAEKPLTDANGNASDIQINQLKVVLKQLKDKDPSKEELIAKIAIETQGFKVISKADCEALTVKIGEMLKEGDK